MALPSAVTSAWPDERREAGLRHFHLVRADGNANERGDGRRSDGLAIERYVRAGISDPHREPSRLRCKLLESRRDEALLARPVLRAIGALSVVVRLVRLAKPAKLIQRVGDAELCPPAGGGVEGRLIVSQRPVPILRSGRFVAGSDLVRGGGLGERRRGHRRCKRQREKERERPRAMGSQALAWKVLNGAGRRQRVPRGGSTYVTRSPRKVRRVVFPGARPTT